MADKSKIEWTEALVREAQERKAKQESEGRR